METISRGGRPVPGFGLSLACWPREFSLDGPPSEGGMACLPAWLAGASAGLTAMQLAVWVGLPLPPRGVLSSLIGVGTGLAVWSHFK